MVLLSLQIGFQLCGDQFRPEKGRDSLQPSGDLFVTDLQLDFISDSQWSLTKWFPNMHQSFAIGFTIDKII